MCELKRQKETLRLAGIENQAFSFRIFFPKCCHLKTENITEKNSSHGQNCHQSNPCLSPLWKKVIDILGTLWNPWSLGKRIAATTKIIHHQNILLHPLRYKNLILQEDINTWKRAGKHVRSRTVWWTLLSNLLQLRTQAFSFPSSLRSFPSRRSRISAFLIFPPVLCWWEYAPNKWSQEVGPTLPVSSAVWNRRSTLGVACWEFWGPGNPSPGLKEWFHTQGS